MVHAVVGWTEEALGQLEDIRRYIAYSHPRAADRLARRLWEAGESLATFPNRGRLRSDGLRELPSVPPYVVIYGVESARVTILSIRHGRQRPLD